MKKTILVLGIASAFLLSGCHSESAKPEHAASHHEAHGHHWNYAENGPTHWEEFSETCGVGLHQSPINVESDKTVAMNRQYELTMHENINSMAKIIDNGHSIKVTPSQGGTINLNGETFELLQFHFHGKSEHTVNGKRYDLVAHLVHQNPITKQLAVVAVFFEEGDASPILTTILDNVGKSVEINAQDLLPTNETSYYHYVGSLTTPPCSENVQWYLLKNPMTASKAQIEQFRKFYVDNQRPVQKLHDRVVESN